LATLGELREANMVEFMTAALDVNSRISPFAVSLLTERDDPTIDKPEEYVVTLVDTVPLGDFEQSELEYLMQSLLTALISCKEIIEVGCREPQAEPTAA
jgi:hypothetical protein